MELALPHSQSSPSSAAPHSIKGLDLSPVAPVFPSPADWRDEVIYELMIDRFDDNQEHPPFDMRAAKKKREARNAAVFQGGTIKGITRRLDYIQGLGATAIWMTPPLKNRQDDPASYHGYGPQDFLSVDPRFGTLADLRDLVREAHSRGMYVIMDIVIDHVGDVWGYENDADRVYDNGRKYEFGHWRESRTEDSSPSVSPIELQYPDAFKRMGRMHDVGAARGDEATDGDFMSLKVLDLENPDVLKTIIAIYKYWIAATDIDGYRIDAFRHVRPDAGRAFCQAVREFATGIGKKNFILIGEVASRRGQLVKYVGNNTPLPREGRRAHYPLLDAALDFPVYHKLARTLKGKLPVTRLFEHYQWLARYYRDPATAGKNYVTFFENHDGGALNHARILAGEKDVKLAILASAYVLLSMGIPCLYYGSEQGFDSAGKGDTAIREAMFGGTWGAFGTSGMHFFNPRHPVYQAISKLAQIRRAVPALRYGRQFIRETSSDGIHFACPTTGQCTLAFCRILAADEVVIAMNLDREARNDCILVDPTQLPPGTVMHDLLGNSAPVWVEQPAPDRTAFVRVALEGRGIVVLRKHSGDAPRA
ncbi:MAG: treZ [Phycisphaerales bacterium]|nr:treZ [Phycisphaerales bacterium]